MNSLTNGILNFNDTLNLIQFNSVQFNNVLILTQPDFFFYLNTNQLQQQAIYSNLSMCLKNQYLGGGGRLIILKKKPSS